MRLVWCLLTAVVALAFVGRVSADDQTQLYYYANFSNSGALQPWINMPHGLREAALSKPIQIFGTDGAFDVDVLLTSLAPAMVIVGLCLTFAILVLLTCPIFYCCRSCGYCGDSLPTHLNGYTIEEKRIAMAVLVIAFIFAGVGAIIGMFASQQMSQGITGIVFGFNHTISDVENLPSKLLASVNGIVASLDQTVNNITSQITGIPSTFLTTSIAPFVANVTGDLRALSTALQAVVTSAGQLDADFLTGMAHLQNFSNDFTLMQQLYNGLGSSYPFESGSYSIVCAPPAIPIETITIPSFPNITSKLSYINTLNLDSEANMIDSQYANLTNVINQQAASISDITNQISPFTNNIASMAGSAINGTVAPFLSGLNSVESIAGNLITQYVDTANYWRNVGTCIIFGFSFIIMLLAVLGLVIKVSCCVTCGAVLAFTLCWFLWIFCALQFIIAVPLGKGCDALQQQDLGLIISPSVLEGFVSNETLSIYLPLAFSIINNCTQPDGNLANIEFPFQGGFSINSAIAPLQQQFQTAINNLNITGLLSGITVSNQIDGLNSVVNQNLTGYETYLQDLLNSSFVQQQDTFNQSVANVTSMLTPFNAINSIPLPLTAICVNVSGGANQANANANATARIQQIINLLQKLNQTELPLILADLNTVQADTTAFLNSVHASLTVATPLIATIQTVQTFLTTQTNAFISNINNNVVPQVLGQANSFVSGLQGSIDSLANCYYLGEDYLAIVNSACVIFVGGLDATWWACGWVASFLIMMIVGLTLVAKRWILGDLMDDGFQDSGYVDGTELRELPTYEETGYNSKDRFA